METVVLLVMILTSPYKSRPQTVIKVYKNPNKCIKEFNKLKDKINVIQMYCEISPIREK